MDYRGGYKAHLIRVFDTASLSIFLHIYPQGVLLFSYLSGSFLQPDATAILPLRRDTRCDSMRRLWFDIQRHRFAVAVFLLYWLITWAVTGATWEFDTSGNSVGMNITALYMHLFLPLFAGALVGWWRSVVIPHEVRLVPSARGGAFVGFLVGEVDLLLLLIWSGALALLGRIPPSASRQGAGTGWQEVLEFIVLMAVVGSFFGMVGGLSAGMLSDQWYRWRGQSKPPAE